MIEVEIKAEINSFKEMETKLGVIGALESKIENQEDIYFQSPIVDFTKTDEALRVRITDNNVCITYKGPKLNNKSKTRKEIEVNIEDSQKACEIFKEIGFEEVRHVKKKRKYYTYENFEISLDDVEGLNPYMEIEICLEDNSDYSDAQDSIFNLYEKLGITEGFETTSYLELLENL